MEQELARLLLQFPPFAQLTLVLAIIFWLYGTFMYGLRRQECDDGTKMAITLPPTDAEEIQAADAARNMVVGVTIATLTAGAMATEGSRSQSD